jgi:hypothetical protein
MNCPICLEELKGRGDVKCNLCVDGAICEDCIIEYCPSGFSYTSNLDKCKCPVCRQVNWKWIKDEMLLNMIDDIYDTNLILSPKLYKIVAEAIELSNEL